MWNSRNLNPQEQNELLARLANITAQGMPLASGLRASATETDSRLLKQALESIANDLESGKSYRDGMARSAAIPIHIAGLIEAGAATDSLPEVISDLINFYRIRRDIYTRLWTAFLYPVCLSAIACGLTLGLLLFFVPPVRAIFEEFGTELPAITRQWFWIAESGLPMGLAMLCGLPVLGLTLRLVLSPERFDLITLSIPCIGKLVLWSRTAEFAWLLRSLLRHRVPLPKALRLTAIGLSNRNMSQLSSWMATGCEAGIRMADMIEATPRLPADIAPLVRWGETQDALAESMESVYEMLHARVEWRSAFTVSVSVPLLFILVGTLALGLLVGTFIPLLVLVRNLT